MNPFSRLTWQQRGFLYCGLALVICFFLPWSGTSGPSSLLRHSSAWAMLLMVLLFTPFTVHLPKVRPWAGIFTVLCLMIALASIPSTGYGAHLTRQLAFYMLLLSANPAIIRATDFAMKRLNSQQAEVSSHWGTTLANLHFSAQDFYAKVERAIHDRQWPGVELLRVQHSEAGLLSHSREYLRVIRQRQVFDVCASTFGKDYFFTLREAEIKPSLTVSTLLIFLLLLVLQLGALVSMLGFLTGLLAFFMEIALIIFLLLNLLKMGLTRVDGLVLRVPVLGPFYEIFLRRSTTYFQHDTRMVFLKLMDELVKEQVDEETSAKGIKLLSCFEHRPIFEDFYRLKERSTDGKT